MGDTSQFITQAAYARHRGVSRAAVSKAKACGRLRSCFIRSDGKILIDREAADLEWTTNTDSSRWPLERRERATAATSDVDAFDTRGLAVLPEIRPELLSAFLSHGAVVFSIANDPACSDGLLWKMTPGTALRLGARLLRLAQQGGQDIDTLVHVMGSRFEK